MGNVGRRRFMIAASALFAAPCSAWAQQPAPLRRIAVLASDGPLQAACTSDPPSESWSAFLDALNGFGYRHGQTVTLECRSAESDYQRLDALAVELLKRQPVVLVAAAAPASLAAKRATSAIPIVSVYTADPVGLGLVNSLARPGGNITGLSALASDYVAKSLQLLKELAPHVSHVGVLGHRLNPTFEIYRAELEPAARGLDLRLTFGPVEGLPEIESALQTMQTRGARAFLVMHQPFTFAHRSQIVKIVAQRRLPAMYGSREAVESGGLISYAVSVSDVWRRAAYFVDRILKGARPADLPVEQPTQFEMAVNRKTAKDLGIAIPPSILLRADRVID